MARKHQNKYIDDSESCQNETVAMVIGKLKQIFLGDLNSKPTEIRSKFILLFAIDSGLGTGKGSPNTSLFH